MTKVAKKLVLSFDEQSQSYKPAGHNLLAQESTALTEALQTNGTKSLVIDQEDHHCNFDFHRCRLCKKAAEDATLKHTQTPRQEQHVSDAVPEESEPD
ncbi:MAG: hypothetical protein DMG65_22180 [Candidatus Angelobacter sp. Gp1-AA117]|nr:MAG: hypothetical protein DMG65_22180 [Candidatus Angelobacter sp. Gp1-AA117]